MSARVAVLRFPGSNCEAESLRAIEQVALSGQILRWNEPASLLQAFDAYILPGGFSYQDRIRAGAVAARLPLVEVLVRRAREGAPIFGICNGAQILVEAGLVPGGPAGESADMNAGPGAPAGTERSAGTGASAGTTTSAGAGVSASTGTDTAVRMALAPNQIRARDGYYTRWVHLAPGPAAARCLFTRGLDEPIPMPMAHGEGRFVTADSSLSRGLAERVALGYARPSGEIASEFPWNPNGSQAAAAGIVNEAGNVLALMPHPERAQSLAHVPEDLPGPWGERRRAARSAGALLAPGPGLLLFRALALHLKEAGR